MLLPQEFSPPDRSQGADEVGALGAGSDEELNPHQRARHRVCAHLCTRALKKRGGGKEKEQQSHFLLILGRKLKTHPASGSLKTSSTNRVSLEI